MSGRDRLVIMAIAVLVVLGAAWVEVVSPERKQASGLTAQVEAARTQLASAEGQVAHARAAQAQYAAAYSAMVSLGKAVPPSGEVPSLIYQLTRASNEKSVDFNSITSGAGGASGAGGSTASAAASTAASSSFSQLPFTFTFEGSYFDLEHLFHALTGFAALTPAGDIQVSGRLLTIQSVKLAPGTTSTEPGKKAESKLTGTITATAYVLPAGQSLTGTPPAGAATPATASPSPSTASSPTAPAIVKVNP